MGNDDEKENTNVISFREKRAERGDTERRLRIYPVSKLYEQYLKEAPGENDNDPGQV